MAFSYGTLLKMPASVISKSAERKLKSEGYRKEKKIYRKSFSHFFLDRIKNNYEYHYR